MKPLVVYYTKTNNTTAIAKAISEELGADCYDTEILPDSELRGRTLIGLGSGTYNTMPAKEIRRVISRIEKGTKVVVFFTSGLAGRPFVAFYKWHYRRALRRHGLNLVGIWNCPGHDKHPLFKWLGLNLGRPNERDLCSARGFAATIK